MIKRRETYDVDVGGVIIGSSHPIRIQSMTNTQTEDSLKTASQIKELYDSGSELVRITVNNEESAESVIKIKDLLIKSNYNPPDWVFAPVWTTLYLFMTIAIWSAWHKNTKNLDIIYLYFTHLFFNTKFSVIMYRVIVTRCTLKH